MSLRQLSATFGLVVGLLIASSMDARGVTLDSVLPNPNGSNTGDYRLTGPRRQFGSDVDLTENNPKHFCVRYKSILAVDVAAGGNTESEGATSSYRVAFNVNAQSGEQWKLKLNSRRKGAYTIVNDNGAYADSQINSGITATSTYGGTLTALQFAGGSATNNGNSGSNVNTAINDFGETFLSGVGYKPITLNFSWGQNVISHGGIFANGGDEAAVRLGMPTSGVKRISAGDYPGLGSRTVENDGHFICVDICPDPAIAVVAASTCSPLSGSPCTFTATGTVSGCLQNNYAVSLIFFDKNGNFVANAVTTITNGSSTWTASVTIPGPCSGHPYSVLAFVFDNPGFVATVPGASFLPLEEFPIARAQVTVGGPCDIYGPYSNVSSKELVCAHALGKNAANLAKTVIRATADCRNAGSGPGSCPDPIDVVAARDKFNASIVSKCGSVCSVSHAVPCITDKGCPPANDTHEVCDGGTGDAFDVANLGFPGPFCESVLGHALVQGDDLAECVGTLTEDSSLALIDALYGSITSVSPGAARCLTSISKAAQKLSNTMMKGAVSCRAAISAGKLIGDPRNCSELDLKSSGRIAKAQTKLLATIDKACTDTQMLELDLCGNGVGGTVTKAQAQDCLLAAVAEMTDTTTAPANRTYSSRSLVEGAYPPARGECGDGVVNQIPSAFLLMGEECDGADDDACPGQCRPPGDVYQCTCANRPLIRFFDDGATSDLDNGWTGAAHDAQTTRGGGYVSELSNCDCSVLSGGTCTGSTSDSVCDVSGFQLPTCSWDPLSATRCDDHGNNDTTDSDSDCFVCDAFNANAGALCADETQCQGQCFDGGGAPQGTCDTQGDCAAGTICRGQCDRSATCTFIPNGAPLAVSAGAASTCVLTSFRENVSGTRSISTGEHSVTIQQLSKVNLGLTNSVPCPVCGGFCAAGDRIGEICEGTCSTTTSVACRFDSDCPPDETCSPASPDCPNSFCNLALVCGGGTDASASLSYGKTCRIEGGAGMFGTTSNDCLPNGALNNISGSGLAIAFNPSTSETVTLPATLPCSAAGFGLFDCPCAAGGGAASRPNACAAACTAGAELAQGCATGAGQTSGELTTCAGGANQGLACDEDSDCPTSACSVNPTHCTGGAPVDELKSCDTNADCGSGVCVDACPSGRCVPLCLESTDGAAPANSENDAEEGVCAAGPLSYHCSGADHVFRTECGLAEAAGSCSAVCATSCSNSGVPSGGSAAPCDPLTPCSGGEVCCGSCERAGFCEAGADGIVGNADDISGAGICVADVTKCVVNDFAAEGGDTLNGNGDATNVSSVSTFCIGATSNAAVNQAAGLGGPGRLRQRGEIVANTTSIP